MKSKILVGLSTAGCLLAGAVSLIARDDKPAVADHNLSEFTLGDHISGEKVDLSDQDGKVVVIEYWGTR